MDVEGYLTIMGRSKDVIIRGGENIYPKEVEDFLLGHPAIQEIAVIGIPDEKFGQIAVGFYKRSSSAPSGGLTQPELKQFCLGEIARYKIPAHLFELPQFPMTLSGKIKKFELVPLAQEAIQEGLANLER
eukprot:TRINITY_DN3776_c0_g1_i3.p1 TRINITY_DN3776_c0_g1~~TRINITY_DN3776_c0_g1_i3.p1  ORF type:complete len:130 (-),score=31.57 TRINITY_DN3776_c0_g1_i3:182-571(-)